MVGEIALLASEKKADKADRYNEYFKYKAGDPGFLVAAADGCGRPGKSAQTR
jgi:hypothetical protein